MRIILVLLLVPCSLCALWVGENVTGGALNPEGLINETILSRRLSFADTNSFLLSDAHLDLGGYLALYPVGSQLAARVKFAPLLFLDVGVLAGAHLCWKHYTFPEGTTAYGKDVRDGLAHGVALLPYISPFWVLKLKFGPVILYNSFYLEKFFSDKLWYYWYQELMVRDGWIFSWNSYLLLELNPKLYLLLTAHLQKSFDTGDSRLLAGPGVRWHFRGPDTALVVMAEYHLKELLFSGIKLSAGLEIAFRWR